MAKTAGDYADEIMNGYCDCKGRDNIYARVKNCWVCVERRFAELIRTRAIDRVTPRNAQPGKIDRCICPEKQVDKTNCPEHREFGN